MNETIYKLLRDVVLDITVPRDFRVRSLDALLVAGAVDNQPTAALPSAVEFGEVPVRWDDSIARDVPVRIGAQLVDLKPIEAIKKLRQLMPQFGLKDAKDRIDALAASGRISLAK